MSEQTNAYQTHFRSKQQKKKLVTEEVTIQFGIRRNYCLDAIWLGWRNFLTHQEALWYDVHEISWRFSGQRVVLIVCAQILWSFESSVLTRLKSAIDKEWPQNQESGCDVSSGRSSTYFLMWHIFIYCCESLQHWYHEAVNNFHD